MTKRCSVCEREYPAAALACLDCDEILEDSFYVRTCWIGLVCGVSLNFAGRHLGYYQKITVTEVVMLSGLCIAIIYPLCKAYQRIRSPERPILAEMLSVYTDRSDRLTLMAMLVAIAVIVVTHFPGGIGRVTATSFSMVRFVCLASGATFFLLWAIVSIIDQRTDFFDPRVANSYIKRLRNAKDASS